MPLRSRSRSYSSEDNGEEREPLISSPLSQVASIEARQEDSSRYGLCNANSKGILLCIFALIVLNQFCSYLLEVPIVRLIERVICERYYDDIENSLSVQFDGGVDENLCKIPEVRSELAKIVGLKPTFDAVPSVITAIYFGAVADRYGRKRVVLLSFLGDYCGLLWLLVICRFSYIFPTRLVWLAALFLFVGGGNRVFLSMMSTIITDQVHNDLRTRFLFLNPAIGAVASLAAPTVSRQMMLGSVWLPFKTVLVLGVGSLLIISMMPESYKPISNLPAAAPQAPNLDISDTLDADAATRLVDLSIIHQDMSSVIVQRWHNLQSVSLLDKRLLICYCCFFLKKMGFLGLGFLYQFVSEKYGWALHDTASLQLVRAIGMTICTLIVIPLISSFIISRQVLRPEKLDRALIVASASVLAISFAAIWAVKSTTGLFLAVFSCGLGEGLEPTLQGLAAFLVDESYTARMFTIVASFESIGRLVGGPLMTWLFFAGYHSQDTLFGFCFIGSSVLFAMIVSLVLFIRL